MQETTGAAPDYPGDDGVTDDFGLAGVPVAEAVKRITDAVRNRTS